MTLQERAPCDCVPQSLSRSASTAAPAVLGRKGGYPTVQNSPARLPDVGLGPRVGLPGRRQPAGYGTSWSVLVSSTSGRSGSSQPDLFHHFPSTNLLELSELRAHRTTPRMSATVWPHLRSMPPPRPRPGRRKQRPWRPAHGKHVSHLCQRWTLWGLDIRDLEILGTGSWSLGGQV